MATDERQRLVEFRDSGEGSKLHQAWVLAAVMWPDRTFKSNQSAGVHAAKKLKQVGATVEYRKHGVEGWNLDAL